MDEQEGACRRGSLHHSPNDSPHPRTSKLPLSDAHLITYTYTPTHTSPTTTDNLPPPPAHLPYPPAPTNTSNLFISTSLRSFQKRKVTIESKTERKRKEKKRGGGLRYQKTTYRTVIPPRPSPRRMTFTPQPHPTFAIDLPCASHNIYGNLQNQTKSKKREIQLLRESDLKARAEKSITFPVFFLFGFLSFSFIFFATTGCMIGEYASGGVKSQVCR